MNTKASRKTLIYRTAAIFIIAGMLFAALPATPARAVSLNITSVNSGTWEATAWPSTQRSGTINVTAGSTSVTGTGTAFLTEVSVGNILRTTGDIQIGTVASITSDTTLTLSNVPATTRTNTTYHVQGVGPADNVTIGVGNAVTIAANAVHQTGTVTVGPSATLTVSNPGTVFSTLTVDGTVNGTSGASLGTLTINNGGLVTAGQNGSYSASSLTINNGGTTNILRAFTVNGATSVTGTISFNSTSVTSRAMVFTGPVILNSGATWTEPASGNGANNSYNFQNDLTNNATTFTTSNTAPHTFSGASKTINGGTNTSIVKVIIAGSYTNNGTLTAGTLSGAGSLTNGAAGTLNLGGTVSITTLANAGILNKTDGGPITTALANFINTGTLNLNGTGTITGITNNAGGTVNLTNSGSINAFNNATSTSTLNIPDLSVPHFGTLTVSAAGNTVNYSGAGDQTVKPITYSNLTFSGSGSKSITMPTGSTLASVTLSIAPSGTAKASITGMNLGVEELKLAGLGQLAGTWGSTTSGATNQNNTYFAGNGYLLVINDTRSPQIITFTSTPPASATVGGTYTPTATGGGSGNPVTFTTDDALICSINGSNLVTFVANGTCVINANQAGDTSFLAATQQQSFDIKLGQTINFTSTPPVSAVVSGATYTPTATGGASGNPVIFTIDDIASSVCSISGGVVSFDAIGTCVIDANQDGTDVYHAASQVQQSFAVGKGAQTINFTSTAPAGAMVGGVTYTPTATATSDLAVIFTIDATASSVCSISASVVSFNIPGMCVINANQPGDTNYNAAPQVQQSFAVAKGAQTISFTSSAPAHAVAGGATYTPTATATSGLTVVFTIDPSASSICSINAGVVSFNAVGTCVIDANQAGDTNYNAAPQVQQSFAVTNTPTFSDVGAQYWAWSFIERLYAAGITGGCNLSPLRYCPEGTVTRAQMAIFLERGINGSSYNPPAVGGGTGFTDVDPTYWAGAWIKQLAADGITGGCGTGIYCPESAVTRAQMAIFLLRSKHGASYSPPAVGGSTGFTDVDPSYWAGAWIKQLVAEGITAGCGSGAYCPEAPVTRAQMAVFLVRTFNLP
jgi:S-layer family protein